MSKTPQNADSLAQRLDETLPAGATGAPNGDPDPLVTMALRLANAPQPKMPPEMAAQIRSQVIAAQRLQKQGRLIHVRSALYWAAVASIAAIFLFGLRPAVFASVPGNTLYPLKQAIESFELLAAGSVEAQAFTHLLHAERRVQEAAVLSEQGQIRPDLFTAALDEIAAASKAVRGDATLSSSAVSQLETRIAQINAVLSSTLRRAQESSLFPESTLAPLATSIWATQNSGTVPPATATPSSTPTATHTPTSTFTVTAVPTSTPTLTGLPTETSSPADTPTQTPSAMPPSGVPTATAAHAVVTATEDTGALNWDDSADCSNPPPTWVPAEGWRARCEGADLPRDNDSNQGPPPGVGPPDGVGPPAGAGPPPVAGRP